MERCPKLRQPKYADAEPSSLKNATGDVVGSCGLGALAGHCQDHELIREHEPGAEGFASRKLGVLCPTKHLKMTSMGRSSMGNPYGAHREGSAVVEPRLIEWPVVVLDVGGGLLHFCFVFAGPLVKTNMTRKTRKTRGTGRGRFQRRNRTMRA